MVGLIMALLAPCTAFLISPLAVLVSLVALFRPGKGSALAGLILGGLGSVVLVAWPIATWYVMQSYEQELQVTIDELESEAPLFDPSDIPLVEPMPEPDMDSELMEPPLNLDPGAAPPEGLPGEEGSIPDIKPANRGSPDSSALLKGAGGSPAGPIGGFRPVP
jgi:hypothetical protein